MSAPDLWAVAGQDRPVTVLRRAVAAGGTAHAWAFVGPAGVGQQEVGRALAAALNCRTPAAPGQPCGVCATCSRCARGVFPAHREFSPTGLVHRVDDVRREWLHAALRSPTEGTWKVLHVHDADRMTEAAANAFLKGLEEPPERTVWLLDLADPDEIPETILSRCRALRFRGWSLQMLADEAARLGISDVADRALAARAALGSPATLRRLAAPGGLEDFRRHRGILASLREEGPANAIVAARDLADEVTRHVRQRREAARVELDELGEQYGDDVPRAVRRQVEERHARHEREARLQVLQAALDDLVGWLRDCLLVVAGGDPAEAISADVPGALRADAGHLGAAGLLWAIDEVMATREALELNVQASLALEALFLSVAGRRG